MNGLLFSIIFLALAGIGIETEAENKATRAYKERRNHHVTHQQITRGENATVFSLTDTHKIGG